MGGRVTFLSLNKKVTKEVSQRGASGRCAPFGNPSRFSIQHSKMFRFLNAYCSKVLRLGRQQMPKNRNTFQKKDGAMLCLAKQICNAPYGGFQRGCMWCAGAHPLNAPLADFFWYFSCSATRKVHISTLFLLYIPKNMISYDTVFTPACLSKNNVSHKSICNHTLPVRIVPVGRLALKPP